MPNPNLIEKVNDLENGLSDIKNELGTLKKVFQNIQDLNKRIIPDIFQSKHIFIENINGLFHTVSQIPTYTPRNFKEQIVLVDSGGTVMKLYTYFGNSWKFQRFYNT